MHVSFSEGLLLRGANAFGTHVPHVSGGMRTFCYVHINNVPRWKYEVQAVRFALLCIFLYLFVPRAVWPHRAPPWHLNNSKRSDLKLANSKWSKTWFRLATNLQAFVAFRSPIFHSGWQVTIQIWILDRVQFLPCCKNAGSTRDLPCVGTDVFSSYTIFTCKPILLLSKFHHRLMMHLCTYDFFCSADTCRIIVLFIAVSSKLDWVRFYIGSPALAHGFRMNPQGEKSSIIWVYHA